MITSSGATKGLDRAAFYVLQAVLFLSPIFFIPSISVPFQTGRAAFMLLGIVLSFALWAIARLKDGRFEMPKVWLYAGAGALALAYTLSAVFSPNHAASYAGAGLDIGSLAFFLPSLILFALVPIIVRRAEEVFYSYAAILASFFVVAIYHVIRFIGGPDTLSFGLLTDATSSILGKWNDLGVFFGFTALVSLITLERAALSRVMKILAYVALVVSLALVVVVNFAPVWISLAVLSLVFLVHKVSFEKSGTLGSRIPYRALAVLILSVLFVFGGSKIGALVAESLGTSQVEVRPSWAATFDVSKATLAQDPVFGAGPNRFSSEWLASKPDGINSTIFWNVDFNYGIGFLPSLVATTGIVGGLAALAFLALLVALMVKALFRGEASPFSRYLVLSSLFGSAYLWIFSVIYVPSAGLWMLTLVMTGLFVASLREDKVVGWGSVSVGEKPSLSFVSVLLTILALIGAVAFAYFVVIKLLSGVYFQKGIVAANVKSDVAAAELNIGKAISLAPSDVYYRSLSEIYLVRINQLLQNDKITQSEAQSQFQGLLSASIQAAQAAVAFDKTNYQNHMALGRVYEAVVPLKIEGAYDSAKASYEAALKENPMSPEIYLVLARLETAKQDSKAAKDYIAKALEKKGDYADAIYLLSQIQIAEGDVANAINSVSAIATLSPNDSGVFFQLGLLYYNQKNYQNAVLALERAITLNPQYANAKYFLGLAYYQVKDTAKALAQFKDLEKTNPDNKDIQTIISNLEAGKAPIPASTNPVTQSKLPVKEE